MVGEGAPQTEQWPRRPCGSGLGPGTGRVQTVMNVFWLRSVRLHRADSDGVKEDFEFEVKLLGWRETNLPDHLLQPAAVK